MNCIPLFDSKLHEGNDFVGFDFIVYTRPSPGPKHKWSIYIIIEHWLEEWIDWLEDGQNNNQ